MAAGNWVRGQTLGRGSTATVSLAVSTLSGESFAVKSVDFSHSSLLQKEERILSSLNSPHIVSYLGFDITVEGGRVLYNLFMEYVSGGTISDEIKRRGGGLDELTIRYRTCEILKGLLYLHSHGIAHCDIKGRNVLLGPDGRAKIADLGCAKWADSGSRPITGTPVFMAPEVARGEEQGLEADVWALGCTVIEMATGKLPWPDVSDPVSAIHRIGFTSDVPEFPIGISKDGNDFLSKCLKRDRKERWTVDQLLQHPFVTCDSNSSWNWNSPKSTLDQDLWNSWEVEESQGVEEKQVDAIPVTAGEQFPGTPQKRIQQLIVLTSSSSSDSNWEFDDNWITVRDDNLAGDSTSSEEDRNEDQISILADEELMGTANYMVTEDACLSNCEFFYHHVSKLLHGDGDDNDDDDGSCEVVVSCSNIDNRNQCNSNRSHEMFTTTSSTLFINEFDDLEITRTCVPSTWLFLISTFIMFFHILIASSY